MLFFLFFFKFNYCLILWIQSWLITFPSPAIQLFINTILSNRVRFIYYDVRTYKILIPARSPRTNDSLPQNSLFWSPPTAAHRFCASDMAVPGIISWFFLYCLDSVLLILFSWFSCCNCVFACSLSLVLIIFSFVKIGRY